MPITDPDVLTVSCRGALAGSEQWANIYHLLGPGTPLTEPEANDIEDIFTAFYAELLLTNLWDQWSNDEIEVKQESAGISFVYAGAGPGAAGNGMPPDCAIVVSWRTAVNTRRGRGRTYLTGFVEGHNDNGLVDVAEQGAIAGAAENLCNSLTTNGTPLAVYSTVAGIANAVTNLRVGCVWDTQRRRDRRLAESYITIAV